MASRFTMLRVAVQRFPPVVMATLTRPICRVRAGMVVTIVGFLRISTQTANADATYSWGGNAYGEIGDGTTINCLSPYAIPSLASGVNTVACGYVHSLALQNGAVYSWGFNGDGRVGDGTTTNRLLPVAIPSLAGGVTAVSGGGTHSLALKNGAVYAWGNNVNGQVGDGTTNNYRLSPVSVPSLASGVTAIAAGNISSFAVQNGAVYAWGNNGMGQLGDGTFTQRPSPVPVPGLTSGVTDISSGDQHILALKNGGVYAWGTNADGNIGDGTRQNQPRLSPFAIPSLANGVTDIADGVFHSLAVKNGEVYAWGWNVYGQLGYATDATDHQLTPAKVPGLTDIVQVAANFYSSYALDADGSLWVWGANDRGQLGLGDTTNRLSPTQLLPPAGYAYTSIDGGGVSYSAIATMTSVPEPGSLALLGLGAVGFLICRRRD